MGGNRKGIGSSLGGLRGSVPLEHGIPVAEGLQGAGDGDYLRGRGDGPHGLRTFFDVVRGTAYYGHTFRALDDVERPASGDGSDALLPGQIGGDGENHVPAPSALGFYGHDGWSTHPVHITLGGLRFEHRTAFAAGGMGGHDDRPAFGAVEGPVLAGDRYVAVSAVPVVHAIEADRALHDVGVTAPHMLGIVSAEGTILEFRTLRMIAFSAAAYEDPIGPQTAVAEVAEPVVLPLFGVAHRGPKTPGKPLFLGQVGTVADHVCLDAYGYDNNQHCQKCQHLDFGH